MEDNEKLAIIDFGKAVKKARKDRKLNQKQLEALSGVSYNYIANIEKGYRNPSLTVVLKLCNCLHLDSQIHFLMATWNNGKKNV